MLIQLKKYMKYIKKRLFPKISGNNRKLSYRVIFYAELVYYELLYFYIIVYISFDSARLACSDIDVTFTFVILFPNCISITSPSFTSAPALTTLPLIFTRPWSHASLASVRLLISLDTFKYLSILITSSLNDSEIHKNYKLLV